MGAVPLIRLTAAVEDALKVACKAVRIAESTVTMTDNVGVLTKSKIHATDANGRQFVVTIEQVAS